MKYYGFCAVVMCAKSVGIKGQGIGEAEVVSMIVMLFYAHFLGGNSHFKTHDMILYDFSIYTICLDYVFLFADIYIFFHYNHSVFFLSISISMFFSEKRGCQQKMTLKLYQHPPRGGV